MADEPASYAPFAPDERAIFTFADRRGPRRVDPMAVETRMLAAMADVDEEALAEHLKSPDMSVFFDAIAKLLPAIRAGFKVTSFEEDEEAGLTVEETMNLWSAFNAWCHDLKADTGPTPSTPPRSDDGPASA